MNRGLHALLVCCGLLVAEGHARAGEVLIEKKGVGFNNGSVLQWYFKQVGCVTIQRGSANGDVMDTSVFPNPQKTSAGVPNGNLPTLFVSTSGSPAYAANGTALMQFSFKNLPGTIVRSADLALTTMTPGGLKVYKALTSWSEKTTTKPLGTSGVSSTVYRTLSGAQANPVMHIDMTELVAHWLSGADPNYGIEIAANPGPRLPGQLGLPQVGTLQIYSSESSTPPQLTVCFAPQPCSGKADGTACDDPAACIAMGQCKAGVCQGGQPASSGTVCRPAADICDVAEVCDGKSSKCPAADALKAEGTACRASVGSCDIADSCSGGSFVCVDSVQPSTHECLKSKHVCENDTYCNGTSGECPKTTYKSSIITCKSATESCEEDAKCTGTSADCPSNGFKSAGTECGAAAKPPCGARAKCTGKSDKCPTTPAYAPEGTDCEFAEPTLCLKQPTCSGKSNDCINHPLPDGSDCQQGSGICKGGHCTACGTGMIACCVGAQGPCPGATGLICQNGTCIADQSHSPGTPSCGTTDLVCCAPNASKCDDRYVCLKPGTAFAKCQPCSAKNAYCCHQDGKQSYGCDGTLSCVNNGNGYHCQ